MKFLVPNYSCLQNPWLGDCRPQIPVLSVLCPQLNLLNHPPRKKIPGYATGQDTWHSVLDCILNVMVHTQKPDFVCRRNGRVHLKSAGASVQSTTGSRGVRIGGSRVQLKRDGTLWCTGGEVKGKLANGVGSQYPSLARDLMYPALLPLIRTPRLPVVDWNDAPADLNGLARFAERRNLVSARVPSHFKHSLQPDGPKWQYITAHADCIDN